MQDLAGRCAIVTGASRGLGVHIARALAAEGMRLVLAARSVEGLTAVQQDLERDGAAAIAFAADVTVESDREALVEAARQRFGGVDVLVNNAGSEAVARFHRLAPRVIEQSIATNLVAPMLLSHLVLPQMLERRTGHIVNMASMAGKSSLAYMETYTSAKAGLIAFTTSLHVSYKEFGIGASAICPGFTEEGVFRRMVSSADATVPRWIRPSRPEAIAMAVVRALRTNPIELLVTPRPVRPFVVLGAISPDLAQRLSEMAGVQRFFRALADARSEGPL